MRIKIVSNFRSEADAEFSVADNFIPNVGDEVRWRAGHQGAVGQDPNGVTMRGMVKKRSINYLRPDRNEVTLEMQDAEPVFNVG